MEREQRALRRAHGSIERVSKPREQALREQRANAARKLQEELRAYAQAKDTLTDDQLARRRRVLGNLTATLRRLDAAIPQARQLA